jgi:hypothetical protein
VWPGHRPEQLGERELVGVGSVLLVAQEDDLVPQQRGPQARDSVGVKVAADPDSADDRADHAADLGDGMNLGELLNISHVPSLGPAPGKVKYFYRLSME